MRLDVVMSRTEEYHFLPDLGRVIYFLFKKTKIVYIGASVSLHRRSVSQRSVNKFDTIRYFKVAPRDDLRAVEAALISFFRPPRNKRVPRISHDQQTRYLKKYGFEQ